MSERNLLPRNITEGTVVYIDAGYYGCLSARKGLAELVSYETRPEEVATHTAADLQAAVNRIREGRERKHRGRGKRLTERATEA